MGEKESQGSWKKALNIVYHLFKMNKQTKAIAHFESDIFINRVIQAK